MTTAVLPTSFAADEVVFIYRVGVDPARDVTTGPSSTEWFVRHRVGLIPDRDVKLVIRRRDDGTLEGLVWRLRGTVAEDGSYLVDGIEDCPYCANCVKGEEYVFPVEDLPPFCGDYDERNAEQCMDITTRYVFAV